MSIPLAGPLAKWLHLPPLTAPWLMLAAWSPYLLFLGWKQWDATRREKQEMEARFAAEDAILFGKRPQAE